METLVLVLAVFCLGIGIAVLWANPIRFTNQAFTLVSLLITAWFLLVYQAVRAEVLLANGKAADPIPWYRANAAILAFIPWAVWLVKESLLVSESDKLNSLKRSAGWFLLGTALALICYIDSFVFVDASGLYQRGAAYAVANSAVTVANLVLFINIQRRLRGRAAANRIELQFLALNVCLAGVVCAVVTALGNYTQIVELKRMSLFVYVATFGLTAWAVSFYRVFDAREVFVSLGQRMAVISILAFGSIAAWRLGELFMPKSTALFASIAVSGSVIFFLDRKSREWLRLDGARAITGMRHAIIDISRSEFQPQKIAAEFSHLLRKQCDTPFVALFPDGTDQDAKSVLGIVGDQAALKTLCDIGWATPESLQRRRAGAGIKELQSMMVEGSLGLIVTVPQGSPTPSLVVTLGTKRNRWPFTYPEVQRLQNIAELMDNILTRSRLTAQEAMKARTEHLAMMSRGLAHDLKNLLTPVSSFLIHTEGRFPAESAEAEVHSAAQRSIRIMGDYVREARFFADRLAPRLEPCSLRTLCESAREIMISRAGARGITLIVRTENDHTITVDSILLQRLLGNLLANAIDASAAGSEVTLSASVPPAGEHVVIQVEDQGSGIAPENLARIFEPYFTTKDFGDDVRGFGLGLTICQKIAALHEGTISVRSELGLGTTFTIELPMQAAVQQLTPPPPMTDPNPSLSQNCQPTP